MDYKNKYLKYKRKYLLLKGGAGFSLGVEPVNSDKQTPYYNKNVFDYMIKNPVKIQRKTVYEIHGFLIYLKTIDPPENIDVINTQIKQFINSKKNEIISTFQRMRGVHVDDILHIYYLIKNFDSDSEYINVVIPDINRAITTKLHELIPKDIKFYFFSQIHEHLVEIYDNHVLKHTHFEIPESTQYDFELGESIAIKDNLTQSQELKLIIILTPDLLKEIIELSTYINTLNESIRTLEWDTQTNISNKERNDIKIKELNQRIKEHLKQLRYIFYQQKVIKKVE